MSQTIINCDTVAMEVGSGGPWDFVSSGLRVTHDATAAKRGDRGLLCDIGGIGAAAYVRKYDPWGGDMVAGEQRWLGFWYNLQSLPASYAMPMTCVLSAGNENRITVYSANTMRILYKHAIGQRDLFIQDPITPGWQYIRVGFFCHATTGGVEVWLGPDSGASRVVQDLAYNTTGTFTGLGASALFNFGDKFSANAGYEAWHDDFVFADTFELAAAPTDALGQYNIYRGIGSPGAIDWTTPVGSVTSDETSATLTGLGHAASTRYFYAVRPETDGGLETPDVSCVVEMATDAAGDWVGSKPAPVSGLSVEQASYGNLRVKWRYQSGTTAPDNFHVWYGTDPLRLGQVGHSAKSTIAYDGDKLYTLTLGSLSEGAPYFFKIVAANGDAESPAVHAGPVFPDATAPATPSPTIEVVY
jgi:hypothetical protein